MRVPIARVARSDFLACAAAVCRICPRGNAGGGPASRTLDASRAWRPLDRSSERHDAAFAKEPLSGSNTERMFQAPFASRNALGVVPNRFLKVIVMCCCEENPDAAEISEIAELVLSSKLQAC